MNFIDTCMAIEKRELSIDHNREIAEPRYMSQESFPDCMSRGKALAERARRVVDNFRALCILLHREKTTDERHDQEKTELMSVMVIEDITAAEKGVETQAFWSNS